MFNKSDEQTNIDDYRVTTQKCQRTRIFIDI